MNKNEKIVRERLKNLEEILFSSYKLNNEKLPMPKWSSFNQNILKGSCIILSTFYDIQMGKNGEIKIEYKPIPVNTINKYMRQYGGGKDKIVPRKDSKEIVARKKSKEITYNVAYFLFWTISIATSLYLSMMVCKYLYLGPMHRTYTISQNKVNDLIAKLSPGAYNTNEALRLTEYVDIFIKLSDIPISQNESTDEMSTDLAVIISFQDIVANRKSEENLFLLPAPIDTLEYNKTLNNEASIPFLFSILKYGVDGLSTELYKPLNEKYKEIKAKGKAQADHIQNIKDKLDTVSIIIQNDVDTSMENANSLSKAVETAHDVMINAVNFMMGSTEETKVGNFHERLIVGKEILRLIPRVTAQLSIAIPNIPVDILDVYGNMQNISNMAFQMYVLFGIIGMVIQTIVYYIIVLIVKLAAPENKKKAAMQVLGNIQEGQHKFGSVTAELLAQTDLTEEQIISIVTAASLKYIPTEYIDERQFEIRLVKRFNEKDMQDAFKLISNQSQLYDENMDKRKMSFQAYKKIITSTVDEMQKHTTQHRLTEYGGGRMRKRYRSKKVRKQRKSKKTRKNTR